MGHVFYLRQGMKHEAPVRGEAISTLPVGSLVKMTLGGKVWEWLIVQQGRPSSMYDVSCDGAWCLLKDCYEERQWNNTNVNDYENSTINTYLNGTWFNLLAPGIQRQVKQVKIPYRPGAGYGKNVNSGGSGLSTRIFLLSGYEVGWTDSDNSYFPRDGVKLTYFAAGTGVAANNKRIAKLNGSATRWWLRSPYCYSGGGPAYTCYVAFNGDYTGISTTRTYAIRPCIILPKTALVDPNGNVLEVS